MCFCSLAHSSTSNSTIPNNSLLIILVELSQNAFFQIYYIHVIPEKSSTTPWPHDVQPRGQVCAMRQAQENEAAKIVTFSSIPQPDNPYIFILTSILCQPCFSLRPLSLLILPKNISTNLQRSLLLPARTRFRRVVRQVPL